MWNTQQQLKQVLVETIQVLCKNSLPNESSFCIEATIGITLSTDHVMVISFKERIKSDGSHLSLMVADEYDNELSHDSSINNKSANYSQLSFSCSSHSKSDNSREDLVSENSTVYEQIDIPQNYSSGNTVDREGSMLNTGIIDSETATSYMPQFEGTEISAGNHLLVPSADKYTITQNPDHDNDTKDEVIIIKVEDGNDNVDDINGMAQLGTELEAPCMQPHLYVQKQKTPLPDLHHARFIGNVEHNCQRQPTSVSCESSDMQQQYVDGPHQHGGTFNAS